MSDANVSESAVPEKVTVQADVKHFCASMQKAIDARVNGFAVELLAESLGDKDELLDGGVMFAYAFDHRHRPVWIIVTGEPPAIIRKEVDETALSS